MRFLGKNLLKKRDGLRKRDVRRQDALRRQTQAADDREPPLPTPVQNHRLPWHFPDWIRGEDRKAFTGPVNCICSFGNINS
jgi:hypothetical protein